MTRRRLSATQRREIILDAAARVFAERGYFDASMSEIASAAGIVPSVIYDHFGSKQKLHLELLARHADEVVAAATLIDLAGDRFEVVQRSTEAFFTYVEEHPYLWRMLFRDPPADTEIAALHARIHRTGTEAIARMVASAPQLRLSVSIPRGRANELIAHAVKSANDGLAAWWYEHPAVPRDQIIAVAVDMAWQGLGPIAASES